MKFSLASVKTDMLPSGAISRLYIANANRHDSGNYTCGEFVCSSLDFVFVWICRLTFWELFEEKVCFHFLKQKLVRCGLAKAWTFSTFWIFCFSFLSKVILFGTKVFSLPRHGQFQTFHGNLIISETVQPLKVNYSIEIVDLKEKNWNQKLIFQDKNRLIFFSSFPSVFPRIISQKDSDKMKIYGRVTFSHFLNSFLVAALGDIAQATVMVHVLIGKGK